MELFIQKKKKLFFVEILDAKIRILLNFFFISVAKSKKKLFCSVSLNLFRDDSKYFEIIIKVVLFNCILLIDIFVKWINFDF